MKKKKGKLIDGWICEVEKTVKKEGILREISPRC